MSARSGDARTGRFDDRDAASSPERDAGGTSRRLAALGGALLLFGLRRRSLPGRTAALAGGWLLYRGIGGRKGLDRVRGLAASVGERGVGTREPASVEKSVTVGRPAEELYGLWRDPESLAAIMAHFAEVTPAEDGDGGDGGDGTRQHWEVRGPADRSVSWDSEIVEERPGELLRWESLPGADLPNEGSVRFRDAPDDRGTAVTLSMRFDPPGGRLGDAAAEYLGVLPEAVTMKSLRRFKSLAETGEMPTLEGNPSARGRGDRV